MRDILTTLAEKVDPAHTAVVVVDMQNDFCAEGGYLHKTRGADMSGSAALAARIMKLVEAARRCGAMVVWIKANYEPRYLSGQARAKLAENGIEDVCCEGGTWGWDFYGVTADPGEWVIEKHTYSGFHGTELDRVLRFNGIRTLVFTGVATNVCVESTARDGYFNGYYIVMPEDCVASHAEDLHRATISNVRMFLGEAPESAALIDIWTEAAGARLREAG